MKDELEDKLQAEFPFMKQTHDLKDSSVYRTYGCECSNGWYELIRDCCCKIADKYEEYGIEVDFIPEQIKEKFGTLRFYYNYENSPKVIPAIDMIGGTSIRFEPGSIDDSEEKNQLRRAIAGIIDDAEERSGHICEFCGAAGELRKDLGWLRTLCDDCYEKMRKGVGDRD